MAAIIAPDQGKALMTYLYQTLEQRVSVWRKDDYANSDYPAITDVPEQKTDLVQGSYELQAPAPGARWR